MSKPTPAIPDAQRIEHYVEILEYCLVQCAEARGNRNDLFLWNARRASEAVGLALAVGTELAREFEGKAQSGPRNQVEMFGKLKALGRLSDTMERALGQVWAAGNLGAHTQAPERVVDDYTLKACEESLHLVAMWFYRDSMLHRPIPTEVQEALADVDRRAKRPTPEAKLRWELQALQLRASALEALVKDRDTTAETVAAPASSHRRLGVLATVSLVAGVGVGLGLSGVSLSAREPDLSRSMSAGVVQAPAAPASQAPPIALSMPTPISTAPPEASSAVGAGSATSPVRPLRCPKDQTLFSGEPVRFTEGPSPRRQWGRAGAVPAPGPPQPFCLDRAPISTGAYRAYLDERELRIAKEHRSPGCNLGEGTDAMPLNCVSWSEAHAFCEARGGRLPSIHDWESAMRSDRHPQTTPRTGEWSSDAFPPAIFGYTPPTSVKERLYWEKRLETSSPTAPWLSWQRKTSRSGALNLAFRCASTPTD
ncbi:MAG: SUMF1/EgtB/PvdO family nonheme iron enzyme [Burkholderiaceae bacterium]